MRWLLGFGGRAILFFATFGFLVVASLGVGADTDLDAAAWGRVLRADLFFSVVVLTIAELLLLTRALDQLGAVMESAGHPRPDASWARAGGWIVRLNLFVCMAFTLLVVSPTVRRVLQSPGGWLSVGLLATLWSGAVLLLLRLSLGGWTLARARWTARALEMPTRLWPQPWLVVAFAVPALALAMLGSSGLEVIFGLGLLVGATVALASLAEGDAQLELLVQLGPDDRIEEIAPVLQGLEATAAPAVPGATRNENTEMASTWVVTVPLPLAPAALLLLEADDENVTRIELNAAVAAVPVTELGACSLRGGQLGLNDPYGSGSPLELLDAHETVEALAQYTPRTPALVAVLDTGVSGTHEDLEGVLQRFQGSQDTHGHGTAVATVLGAVANNWRGVGSLNLGGRSLRIQSFPVLGGPRPGADDVAAAIEDATDAGAQVINLSFNALGTAPTVVQLAVRRAVAQGVMVVASAGNQGGEAAAYWPANLPGVLVVGAVSADGQSRAAWSNRTEGVAWAVSAPGDQVCVGRADGSYRLTQGTSFAAPAVAGLLGTMRAICPGLSAAEAAGILMSTGVRMPGSGLGPRVRVDAALSALLNQRHDCQLLPLR